MGIWDDLTGKTGADASKAAAQDTYSKQQTAVGKLLGYGDEYKANQDQISQSYNPYVQTGLQANDQYSKLLQNPSSVSSLPGYQFDLSQGINAADHSAAARGMDQSGRTLKDLMRFGTGLADNTYGSQLTRLLQGSNMGLSATGQQTGLQSAGNQGQFSARQSAYTGDMTSAGTIGQGNVAAANAQAAGSQNLLNAGLKIGGMALAPFTGGTSLSALMGGFGGGNTNSSYSTQPLSGGDASINQMMFPGYGSGASR